MKTCELNKDILNKLLAYFGPTAKYETEEYIPFGGDEKDKKIFHKITVDDEIIICESTPTTSINKLISNLSSEFTFIKQELKDNLDTYKNKTKLTEETLDKLARLPEFKSKEELLMQLTLLGC